MFYAFLPRWSRNTSPPPPPLPTPAPAPPPCDAPHPPPHPPQRPPPTLSQRTRWEVASRGENMQFALFLCVCVCVVFVCFMFLAEQCYFSLERPHNIKNPTFCRCVMLRFVFSGVFFFFPHFLFLPPFFFETYCFGALFSSFSCAFFVLFLVHICPEYLTYAKSIRNMPFPFKIKLCLPTLEGS